MRKSEIRQIEARLARHHELMEQFKSEGHDDDTASKMAFNIVVKEKFK